MVPVTGRQDKEDGNRPPKAGILPDRGVIAARRRSAIEPRGRTAFSNLVVLLVDNMKI